MTWYLALVGVVLIGMMAMINLMTNHLVARLDDMQRGAERMGKTLAVIERDLDRLRMHACEEVDCLLETKEAAVARAALKDAPQ